MDTRTAAGAALWLVVVVLGALRPGPPGLVATMLLLAVVVLVPTAAAVHTDRRGVATAMLLAGAPVAPALVMSPSTLAMALTLPWLAVAAACAVALALRWARAPGARAVPGAAAGLFLLVGAAWLTADRAGLEPLGFAPPFTLLTAVHFHYAGALTTTVVAATWQRLPGRATATAAGLVVLAPPLVGTGFLGVDPLLVVGAVLLTAGLWTWSWAVLRGPAREGALVAERLAAVAVLVPMGLAVQWALGTTIGTPALSVPAMAATHGVLNALGFTAPAVLAAAHRQRRGDGHRSPGTAVSST